MDVHRLRKGLDVPISGVPVQIIDPAPPITRVALLGADHPGLRARLAVTERDSVRRGELLFEDRTRLGVRFTSPGAGEVLAIHRGPRRALVSVVIRLSDAERAGDPPDAELAEFEAFRNVRDRGPESVDAAALRALLLESGLWTALRTRPFGRVPPPGAAPHALFVNAMDTEPLAADPEVVLAERREEFELGLHLVSKLCEGTTYLCVAADSEVAAGVDAPVRLERFQGPHPAGLPGVHIHHLAPVSSERVVWTLGYQDVLAVAALFRSGRLPVERVIALAGPPLRRPRLVRSRLGASADEHVRGELDEGEVRVVSGSLLSGRRAMGEASGFLGRHHLQVSAVFEGRRRELFGFVRPGARRFSSFPVFASHWLRRGRFDFDTNTHGGRRHVVPIGQYERVMPMDILPTYLLRALLVEDVEQAEKLGCLELDEEDVALLSFVCPSKIDYGPVLRRNLDLIEKQG